MINGIVAIEANFGIGLNGSMPWPKLVDDLKFFKNQTTNNVVIMGSTTWKSLGYKPLSNRINVVLSRTHDYSGTNLADHTFSNSDTALTFCQNEYPEKEIYVIGGSQIYKTFMPAIKRFFVTEIESTFKCDTFFDYNYIKQNFSKVNLMHKFINPIEYKINEYTL